MLIQISHGVSLGAVVPEFCVVPAEEEAHRRSGELTQ